MNEALRTVGTDISASDSEWTTFVMFFGANAKSRTASTRPRKHVDCKVIETKRIEGVK